MSIRVLLVDDHTIVRKGLRSLLDAEEGIDVVGEAGDGREALEAVARLDPDVVLMDISMPRLNGLEATRHIKRQYPDVKVLLLTVHANEEYVYQSLRAGASGYLVKHAAVSDLIAAIRAVHEGNSYLSPEVSRQVIDDYLRHVESEKGDDPPNPLTGREVEVLQLVAEGHTNRSIAEELHISIKTVEAHRARLMSKLGLHSAAELTLYALQRGIVSSD